MYETATMEEPSLLKFHSDNEKILKWLNYHEVKDYQPRSFVRYNADLYTAVIRWDRERFFLPGQYEADPELDYLVLQKVQKDIIFPQRMEFIRCLQDIFVQRDNTSPFHHSHPVKPLTDRLWVLMYYVPGDYAEAARFLWDI